MAIIDVSRNLSKKRIKEINDEQLLTLSAKELQGRITAKQRIAKILAECPWK